MDGNYEHSILDMPKFCFHLWAIYHLIINVIQMGTTGLHDLRLTNPNAAAQLYVVA